MPCILILDSELLTGSFPYSEDAVVPRISSSSLFIIAFQIFTRMNHGIVQWSEIDLWILSSWNLQIDSFRGFIILSGEFFESFDGKSTPISSLFLFLSLFGLLSLLCFPWFSFTSLLFWFLLPLCAHQFDGWGFPIFVDLLHAFITGCSNAKYVRLLICIGFICVRGIFETGHSWYTQWEISIRNPNCWNKAKEPLSTSTRARRLGLFYHFETGQAFSHIVFFQCQLSNTEWEVDYCCAGMGRARSD